MLHEPRNIRTSREARGKDAANEYQGSLSGRGDSVVNKDLDPRVACAGFLSLLMNERLQLGNFVLVRILKVGQSCVPASEIMVAVFLGTQWFAYLVRGVKAMEQEDRRE